MNSLRLSLSLDCHVYDGRLDETLALAKTIMRAMTQSHELTPPQLAIRWFMEQHELTPLSRSMLSQIERDRVGNIETTHREPWDAMSLFPYLKVMCEASRDLLVVLNEQLEDMTKGSCPQGRLYRLLQVLLVQ